MELCKLRWNSFLVKSSGLECGLIWLTQWCVGLPPHISSSFSVLLCAEEMSEGRILRQASNTMWHQWLPPRRVGNLFQITSNNASPFACLWQIYRNSSNDCLHTHASIISHCNYFCLLYSHHSILIRFESIFEIITVEGYFWRHSDCL